MQNPLLRLAAVACLSALPLMAQAESPVRNVVLVHGAFADGSGWKAVWDILTREGYNVAVVQPPETSLADDVAATTRVIKEIKGPVILVGHSYGGVVITQAGNLPEVKGLVYIAALMPDANEDIGALRKTFPASNNNVINTDGFLTIDPDHFHEDFAADSSAETAAFLARSQVPVNVKEALGGKVTEAAWHNRPVWYAVATQDRKIDPDFERFMAKRAGATTIEIVGSHSIYLSQPQKVADLIKQAAAGAAK